jgi:hypothetical protein
MSERLFHGLRGLGRRVRDFLSERGLQIHAVQLRFAIEALAWLIVVLHGFVRVGPFG